MPIKVTPAAPLTANYIVESQKHSKRVQWLVEIDLDRCDLNYSVSPCTATLLADGSRCFYSFGTCQDPSNYTRITRTYRFCLNDVPWPDNSVQVYPLLSKIVTVSQEIRYNRLFVYPEKLSINFQLDHLPLPVDSDKDFFNTARVGEFWRNLIARNRNYAGRAVRVYRGFAPVDGSFFALADFAKVGPDYVIRGVSHDKRAFSLNVESPLAELDRKEVPWTISDDNVTVFPLTDAATELLVTDASEFPDPANFTRNDIYVLVEGEEIDPPEDDRSEYMKVTAVDVGLNKLTVDRVELGSLAGDFKSGATVKHVAFFGTPALGSGDIQATQDPGNVVEVLRDMLEWADVLEADIDGDSFDFVKNQFWPRDNILRVLSKPQRVSKIMQELREVRSIAIYINGAGKWAATMVAPSTDPATYTEDTILEGSSKITEDDARRLTRARIFWDPLDPDESGSKPQDFQRGVVVIDTDLEGENNFGDKKDRTITDPWLGRTTTSAEVRNICRSLITFRRFGERLVKFTLDITENALNVGELVAIQSGVTVDGRGGKSVLPCLITKKTDTSRSKTDYEAFDTQFGGPFARIGPDTMTQTSATATDEDRQYSYWGSNPGNRLEPTNAEGYIYF